MRTQTTIWTALPNGIARAGSVNLSVFVSPQLQTNEGGAHPSLSLFPDWAKWPQRISSPGITFTVTFAGHPPVVVTPTPVLSESRWEAIFTAAKTAVTSYVYEDFSTTKIHSYNANGVFETVSALYGKLGTTSPIVPPVLTTERGKFAGPANTPEVGTLFNDLLTVDAGGLSSFDGGLSAIGEVIAYYTRPAPPRFPTPEPQFAPIPTLDFHQAVSSLGSFPAVMRDLGLVFDLVVPLPHGLTSGVVNVSVVPTFTTAFTGAAAATNHWTNVVVSLATNCRLTANSFRAVPVGPDYGNGMLDLADTSRFSVIDLDLDSAGQQLSGLSTALQNISTWVEPQEADGQTMAMTVPALRSSGPAVIWSGWAGSGSGLNELAARQTTIANDVGKWVAWAIAPAPKGPAPALPVLQAEDIIKGHRFDVLALGVPGAPWRSLHQRIGRYVFGTEAPVALPTGATAGLDEGTSVPGATSAAGIPNPPPDLYVNEAIARWAGWSLAAPRPGPQIDPNDTVAPNRMNPAVATPDANGQMNPQLSASFTVAPGTLPKLRFGERYRYRARAVDLAGNSLGVDVNDASTATGPKRHYRYEPVASPVMAQTAPLGPGEATLLLAIRDYQAVPATPVVPNGRWLFPPKSSELLAEEHGMLDGFLLGHPPNPDERPNPNAATYNLLAGAGGLPGRVDATLGNLPTAMSDTSGGVYFASTTNPTTPWLPDPLSRGATLDGFPGAIEPTIRPWGDGPWPDANPLLLMLEAGPAVNHFYSPGTTHKPAIEYVRLPPGDVLDLAISSALTAHAIESLGVFSWMEASATSFIERLELEVLAKRGQLWMLSPYRVLRLVHAVRLPLVLPTLHHPVVGRAYGSVQASIVDASFVLDSKSTSEIDAMAFWTDPVDDPSDPTNDPRTATVSSQGHAFKALVPDPGPLTATARPMEVFSAPSGFPLAESPGVLHNIGDTLHHLVDYVSTGSSRFAEFFRVTESVTFSGVTPLPIDPLGIDPASVVLTDGTTELEQSEDGGATGDYIVDSVHGVITLTSPVTYAGIPLTLTYIPIHSVTGIPFPVEILSSAAPKAPKIVKVTPAWLNEGPEGTLSGGVNFSRIGGYIRVYIDRPWYSSGAGELLGVVGLDAATLNGQTTLPNDVSPSQVTMMGLDPISVSSLDQSYPIVPDSFTALATVPSVPYRPAYSSPPEIRLLENPTGPAMQIWPYEVQYDPASGLWYADVCLEVGTSIDGPPPGYFVRLALVRFQPYSIVGAEVSTVALATFAQPVPDRFVSVTSVASDPTHMSVNVEVSGTGYYGWRPPDTKADATQIDNNNAYALHPYSPNTGGARSTSSMIVEVQVQDTSTGLTGELAWVPATGVAPVMLSDQAFSGSNEVSWTIRTVGGPQQPITLPFAIGSSTPMRLRISELDYYPFDGENGPVVPAAVNTSFRRPFVAFIPIN